MMLRVGAVLSLTGRFARFGRPAAGVLRIWTGAADHVELEVVDDGGRTARVEPALADLAERCDLLLGPYSTVLTREAARFAAGSGRVVWNHGGSGDDVQAAAPGRLVSILTPTSRYAESFVLHLADHHPDLPLRLVEGRGGFGRQVVAGARAAARRCGLSLASSAEPDVAEALFAAGTFEEDTQVVSQLDPRPRVVGTPAAGVQAFAEVIADPDGVLGVAQWTAGTEREVGIGMSESELLRRYAAEFGARPDYPAVQAVAAATIAVQCARTAGDASDDALWEAATQLDETTLFGRFAVDPVTGAQVGHDMALVQWQGGRLIQLHQGP